MHYVRWSRFFVLWKWILSLEGRELRNFETYDARYACGTLEWVESIGQKWCEIYIYIYGSGLTLFLSRNCVSPRCFLFMYCVWMFTILKQTERNVTYYFRWLIFSCVQKVCYSKTLLTITVMISGLTYRFIHLLWCCAVVVVFFTSLSLSAA